MKIGRDAKGRFIKGHKFVDGGEKGWIKKGQRLSVNTEFKKRSGKWISPKGYVIIYMPTHPYANSSGGVAEHRLVIEKSIGRYLKSNEFVHHLNGDKKDNEIKNLIIMNSSEHQRLHQKLRKEKNENIIT